MVFNNLAVRISTTRPEIGRHWYATRCCGPGRFCAGTQSIATTDTKVSGVRIVADRSSERVHGIGGSRKAKCNIGPTLQAASGTQELSRGGKLAMPRKHLNGQLLRPNASEPALHAGLRLSRAKVPSEPALTLALMHQRPKIPRRPGEACTSVLVRAERYPGHNSRFFGLRPTCCGTDVDCLQLLVLYKAPLRFPRFCFPRSSVHTGD